MLKIILPVVLALIGLAGGGAAGYFLRPPPPPPEEAAAEAGAEGEKAPAEGKEKPKGEHAAPEKAAGEKAGGEEGAATIEYVKLNNQFVIPVIKKGSVASLVVLSLSLEVTVGSTEKVYAAEPKLRDVLLQVLFDHANAGGFEGAFTDTANMTDLRRALTEASQGVLGDLVLNVLISDIARQDSQ
ncbi:flagellar basal body-associated FliL family protein [Rhodobacter capsulatus]|uniref:flagellar basal body-associated FliL family protein n=1 Tax=Rhodobacter capsulatus TaxID=1061 RepID=UPI0040253B3B